MFGLGLAVSGGAFVYAEEVDLTNETEIAVEAQTTEIDETKNAEQAGENESEAENAENTNSEGASGMAVMAQATPEETAVDSIVGTLDAAVKNYNTSKGITITTERGVGRGPVYLADGMKAYTEIPKGYYVQKTSMSDTAEGSVETVMSALVSNGYNFQYIVDTYPPARVYVNQSTGIACEVSTDYIFVTCGHKSWWGLNNGWTRELINGLGQAYYNKEFSYPYIYTLGSVPEIKSGYGTYQNISVATGDAALLFYRAGENSAWVYLTGTQSWLGCDWFSSEDAAKGFYGEECYDANTKTNIKIGSWLNLDEGSDVIAPKTGLFSGENNAILVIIPVTVLGLGAAGVFAVKYGYKRSSRFIATKSMKKHTPWK